MSTDSFCPRKTIATRFDKDDDGLLNEYDNCPDIANRNQKDSDSDGIGDACDNCPFISNSDQADRDHDLVGDACDTDEDRDSDGIQDSIDNCPDLVNSDQLDTDEDGKGDACDTDKDNDGIANDNDNCPLLYNPRQDISCRDDFDGDGIPDRYDICPENRFISSTNFTRFHTVILDPNGSVQDDPNWIITDNGKQIEQTINSDPGLAVGDERFDDIDFLGTLFVADKQADDDFVGFIFGYQDNKRFYVVAWKRAGNKYFSGASDAPHSRTGVHLKVVNSTTGPGEALRDALWANGSTPGQATLLWSDENEIPWELFVPHRWSLIHRPSIGLIRVKLFRNSDLIVDSGYIYDHTLQGGRLGVYCFSQEQITWSNLEYRCNRADPRIERH